MKIFHYDNRHGLLIGTGTADESPLEPGVFLIPALATSDAPPAQIEKGTAAFWRGAAWSVEWVPDAENAPPCYGPGADPAKFDLL